MNLLAFWMFFLGMVMAAAVALRFIRRKLPPVRLEKVAPEAAAEIVEDFLRGATDTTLGFPTGFFFIDDEASTSERVVARERFFWQSDIVPIVKWLTRVPGVLGRWLARIGSVSGALALRGGGAALGKMFGYGIGFALGVWLLFVFVGTVALPAAVLEIVLRQLLRSEIVAEIASLPGGVEGSQVEFVLRGPSALIVGKRLRQAFDVPILPERIRALAKGIEHAAA